MISVVILAGGFGTRLKNVYGDVPKPLVKICGVPMLELQIKKCSEQGLNTILIVCHYGSDQIQEQIGNGERWGVTIKYHIETTPKGTGGALLEVAQNLEENILVLFGDTYFNIDLKRFVDFHATRRADATVFAHPNDHPYDSDLLDVDQNDSIIKVYGYPHREIVNCRNLVSAGMFVFNRPAIESERCDEKKIDIAKDIIPLLICQGKKILAYVSPEYIKDAGTPERIAKVENEIKIGLPDVLANSKKRRAVFIDRDGTIIEDVGHLADPNQIKIISGAGAAIKKLNKNGYIVICITNQPVVARGCIDELQLNEIHNRIEWLLGLEGAYIDKIYYCPHHPDSGFPGEVASLKRQCTCRKPEIELFNVAQMEYNIDPKCSWMVGDSTCDIKAADNASIRSILLATGKGGSDQKYDVLPNFSCKNIVDAVELILNRDRI